MMSPRTLPRFAAGESHVLVAAHGSPLSVPASVATGQHAEPPLHGV
jgi:hypothetical protein